MVRFGETYRAKSQRLQSLFQFQYGAIWSSISGVVIFVVNSFQFQYGAIWSCKIWIMPVICTKFQFQYGAIRSGTVYRGSDGNVFGFNSSMVRFGAPKALPTWTIKGSFNSSMVRFGGFEVKRIGRCVSEFQFQYGAIWSANLLSALTDVKKFQFQYGAIWRVSTLQRTWLRFWVSIPVWCDLEAMCLIFMPTF